MHTTKQRKKYTEPKIISIKLDKEISLAMESDAPPGPNEVHNNAQEYQHKDPYKIKA